MPRFGAPDVRTLRKKKDKDGLIQALRHKQPRVRAAAALALGDLNVEQGIPTLISALQDPASAVRKNACMALGRLGDASAVEALMAAMQDENFAVSTAAATALGQIGDARAKASLEAALEHESTFLRKAAAQALKQFVGAYQAKRSLEAAEKTKTTPAERVASGMALLKEACAGGTSVNDAVYVKQAVDALEPEGAPGARALAELIAELLTCRSPKIKILLEVAEQVEPAQELIDAVLAVKEAPELAPMPVQCAYTAQIVGDGKVGWTTGTHADIRRKAVLVLEKLTGAVVQPSAVARPGADLAQGDFEDVDWDSADLTGVNLQGANLQNAILRHATLTNANLEGADLRGANLYFANLTGANLDNADLRDANLYMSVLKDATLAGANVTDAYVQGAVTLPNGRRGGIKELKQCTLR